MTDYDIRFHPRNGKRYACLIDDEGRITMASPLPTGTFVVRADQSYDDVLAQRIRINFEATTTGAWLQAEYDALRAPDYATIRRRLRS